MKNLTFILFFFTTIMYSQKNVEYSFDKDVKETLSWINKKLEDNSYLRSYKLKEIVLIDNEPTIIVDVTPGKCDSKTELYRIPIKLIKPVKFVKQLDGMYELIIETKNGEEYTWYQSEDKTCGQIGDYMIIDMKSSIKENDLIKRLTSAFNHLMGLYGNDGKEKF